ncbi:hypothetical protein F0562_021866 [Nyssa sinensis]|uniref:Uncharacterized protein n=1 Tax=Nyssa sinensis TaxID=561372 RepID=A0A5J5BQ99_9ASTE|nr:hypothetical protein F0562_021866 [Nyssa sinensis]
MQGGSSTCGDSAGRAESKSAKEKGTVGAILVRLGKGLQVRLEKGSCVTCWRNPSPSRKRKPCEGLPINTMDPDFVRTIGAVTALETRSTGIAFTFAPCIAVCRDPRWGRCYESYSEDPKIVQEMTDIIYGLQGKLPTGYPEDVPYVNGGKITSPPHANYRYSVEASIHAGLDMVMVPYKYEEFISTLTSLVEEKIIPMSRVDDAVSRILKVKFTMGLFEHPIADLSQADKLGCQEHRDLAREAVRKSMGLLKNGKEVDSPMLPLPKKTSRMLVTGIHADNFGYQCGGWTIARQGLRGNHLTSGTTILSAIVAAIDPSTKIVHRENPELKFINSNKFSNAIVVVGELPYAETAGDNLNLTIPEPVVFQNLNKFVKAMISKVSAVPLVGLLFLFIWTGAMAESEYMKYKDPKQPINARIQDLMNRMTLAEKIGQMAQLDRVSTTPEIMKNYSIGSLLSGGGSAPCPRATAEDWVKMVNEFQKGSLSSRLGIPMIYGIDAVHGHNNVYKATIFPHNIGLGATRDPDLVKRIGAATALEVRATGIPYVFAPCIAVCRDPRWGRCYESYSEDHKIVQEMTEIINGLQGEIPANSRKGVPYVGGKDKVVACAKHFVGDGGTTRGINENNTVTDWHGLLSIHMPAYYNSIIKGVSTVMVSYSSWNGVKMHANHHLVTKFLKDTLKFRGFVISDWHGIDKITSPPKANYTYAVQVGIQAGIDMVMVPYNQTEFIDILTSLVEKNVIPMSRINDAVRRILRVKFSMGLFENPLADLSLVDQLGKQAHRDLAREAVRKSLVLLKNGENADSPLLPLPKKTSRILVAGNHANNLGYQCGGWTITWQGLGGNNLTSGTTILSAISGAVYPSTEIVYSENPDAEFVKSTNASYAIVVVGEPPYTETVGDNLNLTIPEPGPSTISNVCGSVKCVVVIISGRPLVIEPYLSSIDALVAAWLPGSEGQGVADVLFGDYGFTGKLSRTWFKTVDQLPMNVGDEHYDPLFPFGFGLTTEPVVVVAR